MDFFSEGNMVNLYPTIPVNIFWIPGKIENVYIKVDYSPDEIKRYTKIFKELCGIFAWSYDEIPGIDPCIVEYEIKA